MAKEDDMSRDTVWRAIAKVRSIMYAQKQQEKRIEIETMK